MFGTQNYGGGFTQQGGASYRPQQAQQQSAESLSLDDVMQGGAPSAFSKDDPIGTSVEGEIVEIRAEQQTDFTTGEPLFYPTGKAKPSTIPTASRSRRSSSTCRPHCKTQIASETPAFEACT